MKTENLQNQLIDLSLQLGCEMVQQPNMAGMMYVEYEPPKIKVPTIDAPDSYMYPTVGCRYLVGLHELGHVRHGHTQGRPPFEDKTYYFDNGVLRSEAEAWDWALDMCLIELTEQERRFMWDYCLGSYYEGAKRAGFGVPGQQLWNGGRHHVKFAYDEPDDYFWQVVNRIKGL